MNNFFLTILCIIFVEYSIGQTLVNLNTGVTGTCEWKFELNQGRMEILNCDLQNEWSGPYSPEGSPLKYTIFNKQCGDLNTNYDQVTFFYTPRTGNGSIVGRIFEWQAGLVNHFGLMVRESAASNSRMLFFGLPNIYDYAGYLNNFQARVFYRTTTASIVVSNMYRDKMLDGIYFGYSKIERVGDTLSVYVSDDSYLWVLYFSYTFPNSLPNTLLYGFASNARQGGNFHYHITDISTEGFACGPGKECKYTNYRTNCFDKPKRQSCGLNHWYKRIASNHGVDQLYGFIPTMTVSDTNITLRSRLYNDLSADRGDDVYIMAFKEVSGDGSVWAEVHSFIDFGVKETPYAGVIVRKNLANLDDQGTDVFYCVAPVKRKVEMRYRPSHNGGVIGSFLQAPDSAPTPDYINSPNEKFTVKITKVGTNFTCSYKTTSTQTWTIVGSKIIPITGTYYAGIVQDSDSAQEISTVYTNINFDGFSGFCGDHGDCQTVNGKLDKCVCRNGWTGDQCQYPICFGKNSTDPTVCNGRGNCTSPDYCQCAPPNEHLHNACESFLYDFKTHVCQNGCTLNDTAWKICVFEQGPTCFCSATSTNLINADPKVTITCDGSNDVKSISIVGSELTASLPDFMVNFTALESLDLSYNRIKSSKLLTSTFLPNLKVLNLSYNHIDNLGNFYDPSVNYFPSFKLIMDGNSACGVFPPSWVSDQIDLQLVNHSNTFWCSTFNPDACSLLKLVDQYILFPSESTVFINYTSGVSTECQNTPLSNNVQLLCESRNGTSINRTNSIYKSMAPSEQFIECPKSGVLQDEFQKVNLAWKYNSSLIEVISTPVDVVNLRYINIISHDRHLIFSNNTGNYTDITLTIDQNITRYRKLESEMTMCKIMDDDYYSNTNILTSSGTKFKCSIKLNTPNTGKKTIDLYDHSKNYKLNSKSFPFWLVNPKNPIVDILANRSVILFDNNNNLIPGVDGFKYDLNNTQFNMNYSCTSTSEKIQYCDKLSGSYSLDMVVVPLEFTHGSFYVTTIDTLFYKKNQILSISPNSITVNTSADVFITFNSSTFNTSLTGIEYNCLYESKTVPAVVINTTTLKCSSVINDQKVTTKIEIQLIYLHFKGVLFTTDFHFHGENLIHPSMSTISRGGSFEFLFSYVDFLPSILDESLECQLSDGSVSKATMVKTHEFKCNLFSTKNTNLTFWYKNAFGSRYKLSSNSIPISIYNLPLKFNEASKQFGNTLVGYRFFVEFNRTEIPTELHNQISCGVDGLSVNTVSQPNNLYNCSISSEISGYKNISMLLSIFAFKVENIHNTFKRKYEFVINTTQINQKKVVFPFNGQDLISQGLARADCKDIVITFKGMSIPRKIVNCNGVSSSLEFLLMEDKIGPHTDYLAFTGNPVAVANETIADFSAIPSVFQSSVIEKKESMQINQNYLEFGFIKLFSLHEVNPFAALGKQSRVFISSNYESFEHKNRIEFKMSYAGNAFTAKQMSTLFESNITTSTQGINNISMVVVYKPSNETVVASNDLISFIFMDSLTTNSLTPFVYQYETPHFNNKQIIVSTNESLVTDRGLTCRYKIKNQVYYSSAELYQNSHNARCTISLELSLNIELVYVELYVNSSSDSNLHFTLSKNNLTLPIIKSPIEISLPLIITKFNFGKQFELNFTNPFSLNDGSKLSISNYRLKVIPENPAYYSYIDCSLTSSKPNCSFTNLIVDRTPSKLNFQVEFYSNTVNHDPINITTTSHYYRENVTFSTESPFITDNFGNLTLTVDFNITQNLNSLHNFSCLVSNKLYPIKRGALDNLFTCTFEYSIFDKFLSVGIYLNDSSIQGMSGIISNEDSKIEVLQLKFMPEYSQNNLNSTLKISRNDSSSLIIPTKYQNLEYRLTSRDSFSFTFSCFVSEGVINCEKTAISIPAWDMLFLYFRLEYKPYTGSPWKELTIVRTGLISFERNPIASISPLVGKAGSPVNVTITFETRTLKVDSELLNSIDFYCSDNNTNTIWNGAKFSDSSLSCYITSNNFDFVKLTSMFQTTFAKNQSVHLTSNSYPFYFLKPSSVQLMSSNDPRFFLTSTYVTFNINITMFIPATVHGSIKAKLNDNSGYQQTSMSFVDGNSYTFNSNVSTSFPGKKDLTLWFFDGSHEFQISNDSIEVVFAKPGKIIGIGPSVAIVNTTNIITIQTLVDTSVDYGNSTFHCKYGRNETRDTNSTVAIPDNKGQFQCNLYSLDEGYQFVTVWMSFAGIEKKLTLDDVTVRFVSSDYFTPSFGISGGGESVSILKYEGAESNVTFKNNINGQNYLFICKLDAPKLNCITPKLNSDFPIYSSHALVLTLNSNRSLSLPFIIYENRKIVGIKPQVISSSLANVELSISLNRSLMTNEGAFFLTIAYKLEQELRYNLGEMNNTMNATISKFTTLPAGKWNLTLFYFNLNSVEFKSMFPISPDFDIYFLGTSAISYVSNSRNILRINEKRNLTVHIDNDLKLDAFQKPNIKCKLGNNYVETYYDPANPSDYTCSVESSTVKIDFINLWYKDSLASNGEILVSSKQLPVFFVTNINITSISPFASLEKSENLTINSTLSSDIYGSNANYLCIFNGISSEAKLVNNLFYCTISSGTTLTIVDHVQINITSPDSKYSITLADNRIEQSSFYFLNPIQTNSMNPFVTTYPKENLGMKQRDIQISLQDDLILGREIYCQYKSSDGIQLSKAQYVSGNKKLIECAIQKQNLENIIEMVDVVLWVNASGKTFILSSNNETHLFVKEPFEWKNGLKLLDTKLIKEIELNVSIPQNLFNYQLQMTPILPQNSTHFYACNLTTGYPICYPSETDLNAVKVLPVSLEYKFNIIHKISNIVSSVKVASLVYHRDVQLEMIKPLIFSHFERVYSPLRIIMSIKNEKLNFKAFSFKCNVTTNSASQIHDVDGSLISTELENGIDKDSHFTCSFTAFGQVNSNYHVRLMFTSELGNVVLTPTSASIRSTNSLIISPTKAPASAQFNITTFMDQNYFTILYTKFQYSLRFFSSGSHTNVANCTYLNSIINCNVIPVSSNWTSSKKLRTDLFIGNVRAMAMTPFFTFYPDIEISKIQPSSRITKLTSSGYLYFTLEQYEYLGTQLKVRYSLKNEIHDYNCTMIEKNLVKCPIPSFNSTGDASIQFSSNDGIYQLVKNQKLIIYDHTIISLDTVTPTELSFINQTHVEIAGKNFPSSPDIIVKIFDTFIEKSYQGKWINDSKIQILVDAFYRFKIIKRSLRISVSFDGGSKFIGSSLLMTVQKWRDIKMIPSLIKSDELTTGIYIEHFPTSGVYTNSSESKFEFYLTMNTTANVKLNCELVKDKFYCNLTSKPVVSGYYDFKMILIDQLGSYEVHMPSENAMYVYSNVVVEILEPKIFDLSTNNPITITSNINSNIFTSALFRFTWLSPLLSTQTFVDYVNGNIQGNQLIVKAPIRNGTFELAVSFNDKLNFHPIASFEEILSSRVDAIVNIATGVPFFFSFQESFGEILGNNFVNTGKDLKIMLFTGYENIDITSISRYNFTSSSKIVFRFPTINELNVSYTLRLPLDIFIGITFNGGYDYHKVKISYLSTFLQPTFTGILPRLAPKVDLSLTLYGVNMNLVAKCGFYEPQNLTLIHLSNVTETNQTNTIKCFIPENIIKYSELLVTVFNAENDQNSKFYPITFYTPPVLTRIEPSVGISSGGFPLSIITENVTYFANTLYCRVGNILCDKPCTMSASSISCTTPSHPAGSVDVEISFNQIHWHGFPSKSTKFLYTACIAGYTSSTYRQSCTLCPPGTFKPVQGLFDCIPCDVSEYNEFSGSLKCEKCPANTTTNGVKGASSHRQCVCDKGFYYNPEYIESSNAHKRCIECPIGSSCPSTNITIPFVEYGFWRSDDNSQTYYRCLPEKSCGGVSSTNCTEGYSGPRCGFCSHGYYRFRRDCNRCEEGAWLRLIGIVFAMGIITGIFFLLSSTKVHHIASIAIAFSFWQVLSMFAKFDIKWPLLISGSLTGASAVNFNTDFLSPNCVFRDMDYVSLWTLQMMMPVGFFLCFGSLYVILLIRSVVASAIGRVLSIWFEIVYFPPKDYDDDEEEEEEEDEEGNIIVQKKKKKSFVIITLVKVRNLTINVFRNIANFTIWWFTKKSTGRELVKIFNRVINAIFAFLSFSFIFIMTTASEVFVCKLQPNGLYTLNNSPDIFCYQGIWWYMFPLSILWYIIFGGGSFLYFTLIYFKFKDWSKSTNFNERNKFMLSRFKKRLYFWEAVITLRKTILSILYIFLDPMLVVVSGIFLMYMGFLLHTNFIPFKRKFHNIMDYFVILVTMSSLFFGLLFFVDKFPSPTIKSMMEYIAFFVLIGSTIIVICMILWDARTRKRHDQKKERTLQKFRNKDKERDDQRLQVLYDFHGYEKNMFGDTLTEHLNMFGNLEVPWDVVYNYTPLDFKTDSESAEDGYTHMNQIFADLLSIERLRRNMFSIEKRGLRTGKQIVRRVRNISRKKTEIKQEQIVVNEDDVRRFEKRVKEAFSTRKFSTLNEALDSKQESKVRLLASKNVRGNDKSSRSVFGESKVVLQPVKIEKTEAQTKTQTQEEAPRLEGITNKKKKMFAGDLALINKKEKK